MAIDPSFDEAPQEQATPTYGDTVASGFLLDEGTPPEKICQYLHDEWAAQKDRYAKPILESEVNARRRSGEANLWVQKVQDTGMYRIYEPHGGVKYSQWYQKADRLCHRMVAVLHPDPPDPEAIPMSGEDEDRDSAEMATRILRDICSESGLNDLEGHKQAFDWANNSGSTYIWYKTDPYGGGRQPIEVEADPMAQTVEEAQPGPTSITKFVMEDGTLGDDPLQAARRWVPTVSKEVVDMKHVRLLPMNATDIWDATGLLYASYQSLGTLKNWFPELQNLTPEDRDAILKFRLKDADYLMPKKGGKPHDPKPKEGHEDDGLALLMIKWCVETAEYPEGAYVVTVGDKSVPHRGTWTLPNGKRDLPFTQVIQFRGGPNELFKGMMHYLGPSNENRGELVGQMLNILDEMLNQKILLPMGSTLQPEDFESPFNTTLYFQPGYEPKRLDGPRMPREVFEFLEIINRDMNDATGMGQASAEGLEAPNVQSGRHALAIQSSQQAALTDLNQNINRAFVRGWRIILQCIQADFDVPQALRFTDEDGEYKVTRFMGSDVLSIRDIQIKRGTGTLFNPAQKAQYVAEYAQLSQTPPEEVRELLATGYNPYTNLQDDEHLMRIRGQLARWEKGPPMGWEPPPPPEPTVQGVDQMSGEPILGPPAPPPPDPIFEQDQRPIDGTPIVANVRIREIGKKMSSGKYGKQTPEWRDVLNREFFRMQQVLMPPPMPAPPPGEGPPPGGPQNEAPALSENEQQMAGGPPA